MTVTIDQFKEHIEFEQGMSDAMLQTYLSAGTNYINNAIGSETHDADHLILMVASLLYAQRVPESSISQALDAITPLIVQEQVMSYEIESTS